MAQRRITLVISEGPFGNERRVSISIGPVLAAACAMVTLPMLVGVGAAWKAKSDISGVYASHRSLELENSNYRTATEALSGQIQSLQSVISDLAAHSALDPSLARAIEKLPAFVKSRAMGGSVSTGSAGRTTKTPQQPSYATTLSALTAPEDTFGLLRMLLENLESRLHVISGTVERREALAEATPSIWPTHGWLSSTMGPRRDPVTGDSDFHAGLDIAGDKGQPVYATASGTVTQVGYQGAYGNMIVLEHGFGLETRYGHLSGISVKKNAHVKRGDIIGRVGSTGRATGNHLHYEVLANGRLLNPLQLLTQRPRDR